MQKHCLYTVFLTLLLLAGCQKAELPPDDFGTPVFSLQTSAGEITAGLNNYYLFTDVAPGNTVSRLRGAFAPANCPTANCPGSLILEIGYLDDLQTIDSFLQPGFFPYIGSFQPTTGYLVSFETAPVLPNAAFLWDFGDGASGDGPVAEHLYADDTPRFATLMAEFPGGFKSRYTELIRFDTQSAQCPGVSLLIESDTFGAQLTALPSSPGSYTFNWSNGETVSSIIVTDTTNTISVTVTDSGQGCSVVAQAENLNSLNTTVQTPYFLYTVDTIAPPTNFPAMSVTWVDSEGIRWSSELQQQPLTSFFEIKSTEPYSANINGLPSRKIEAEFQCVLYNDSGAFMNFFGLGIFAVGIPN